MPSWSALTTLPGAAPAEALGEALERLSPAPGGIGVFEIEDGSGRWEVGGFFDAAPDIAGLALLASLHGAADFAVSRVEDRDWVAQVRRELHPVHAGRFTVFGGHDSHRVGPHRVGLRIEAAMAFGTGHHATTQGCLRLIDRLARQSSREGARPRRVADIGCGTGVLAMAAVRVWRARCVATDIDEVAAATARENVRANRLGPWIATGRAPGFRLAALRAAAPFDLVCANILAGPLKRLAPEIARHLAPGGHVVLSGILRGQAAGIEAVFRGHGMRRVRRVELGDWVSLLLRRGRGNAEKPEGRARRLRPSVRGPLSTGGRHQKVTRPARSSSTSQRVKPISSSWASLSRPSAVIVRRRAFQARSKPARSSKSPARAGATSATLSPMSSSSAGVSAASGLRRRSKSTARAAAASVSSEPAR